MSEKEINETEREYKVLFNLTFSQKLEEYKSFNECFRLYHRDKAFVKLLNRFNATISFNMKTSCVEIVSNINKSICYKKKIK